MTHGNKDIDDPSYCSSHFFVSILAEWLIVGIAMITNFLRGGGIGKGLRQGLCSWQKLRCNNNAIILAFARRQ